MKVTPIKQLALDFLKEHVGKIVSRAEIERHVAANRSGATTSGTGDVTRRIRELKDQGGWLIETDKDRAELRPGQYRLVSLEQGAGSARTVSLKQRARILLRDGCCVKCGLGARDPNPYDRTKLITLRVDHITPVKDGGANTDDNLQTLCDPCNAGKKAFYNPSKATHNLLAEIKSRPEKDQREVFQFLQRKFGG